MIGILFSIIAGISMSFQGVLNTRLSEKTNLWTANFIVQSLGFILSLFIILFTKSFSINNILKINKIYFLGGAIGVIIVFSVMKSMHALGPTCAVALILIAQLSSAAIIDYFGFFGSTPIKFGFNKIVGVITMLVGVILFKWKC